MPDRRVAVVGSDTLLGKEIAELVVARRFARIVALPAGAELIFLTAASEEPLPTGIPVVDCLTLPHPAATALNRLIPLAAPAAALRTIVVTVFDSASRFGLAGIHELERQTSRLLGLQSLPTEVFGGQMAFNLRPAPQAARAALVAGLDPGLRPPPAVQLLQAPIFHGTLLSVFLTPATARPITAPGIAAVERLDILSLAGDDDIQLAPPRGDGDGVWLYAGLDNLRHTALAALAAAGERLR